MASSASDLVDEDADLNPAEIDAVDTDEYRVLARRQIIPQSPIHSDWSTLTITVWDKREGDGYYYEVDQYGEDTVLVDADLPTHEVLPLFWRYTNGLADELGGRMESVPMENWDEDEQ